MSCALRFGLFSPGAVTPRCGAICRRAVGRSRRLVLAAATVALRLVVAQPDNAAAQPTYLTATASTTTTRVCVDDVVPPEFCGTVPTSSSSGTGVALADMDGDGDIDLVVTDAGVSVPEICYNNGGNVFPSCEPVAFFAWLTMEHIAIADYNLDGKLDIAFGADEEPYYAQMCLNVSGGLYPFSCSEVEAIDSGTLALVAADVNDDGKPDLVATAPARVCLNDGSAGFASCSDITAVGSDLEQKVALADLDGDGNLDAVVGSDGFGMVLNAQICRGNGQGLFTCSTIADTDDRFQVALGDIDGDGSVDVVLGTPPMFGSPDSGSFCPGDGQGSVTGCFAMPEETDGARALAVADIDADGRVEIAFAKPVTSLICRFVAWTQPPDAEPEFDCDVLDTAASSNRTAVALWTPLLFQDGFQTGDASRWSLVVD